MKHYLSLFSAVLWGVAAASQATEAVYVNEAPSVNPNIDATTFINISRLDASTVLPFYFKSCLFYENEGSGVMMGNPGFIFDFQTNNLRYASANFVNQGDITVATNLAVYATNIFSSGRLLSGPGGIVRLLATNDVDVSYSGLRSGSLGDAYNTSSGVYLGSTYYGSAGVYDVYWGVGSDNVLSGRPNLIVLYADTNYSGSPNFAPPYASSPSHQVIQYGQGQTTAVVPSTLFGLGYLDSQLYDVRVFTNAYNPTNLTIQMIFFPTNFADSNLTSDARFSPMSFDNTDVTRARTMVRFATWDYDIVLQQYVTNFVYIIDDTATTANLSLQRNAVNGTMYRPNTIAVVRESVLQYDSVTYSQFTSSWDTYMRSNSAYAPELVYNPTYRTNRVTSRYTAYGAQIGEASTYDGWGTLGLLGSYGYLLGTPPVVLDPTNMPGRVEVAGERVSLDSALVRAESFFSVKTRNLQGNSLARVDAPFLSYDLGTVQPVLEITNLAPAGVRRLTGGVEVWSGVWTNIENRVTQTATNSVTNAVNLAFHVMIVGSELTSLRPVVVHQFAAHATNLVIGDPLSIGHTMLLDATNVHVIGSLALPMGHSWGHTNVVNLVNLTNDGTIYVPQAGFFGWSPASPYDNIVNRGIIQGASHYLRCTNFENRVSPTLANSGSIWANNGGIRIDVHSGYLSNSLLNANGSIQLFADNLVSRNTAIGAGSNTLGSLTVAVTNSFSDGGPDALNYWIVTAGFDFRRKPATGDLMGTTIESRVSRAPGRADHYWAAEDRGADPQGFTNNMALGRLVLDSGTNSGRFFFIGATNHSALYVDYLDLRNMATNYGNSLVVSNCITVYFANASVPPYKLDGRFDGHLRWISSYAGPNSSTNIVYPSGQTYTFNIALAQSPDIDSDGDGVVNLDDPTPFYVAESVNLEIGLTKSPVLSTRLTWNALAQATNVVEYATDLGSPSWQELTNFVGGMFTAPVSVVDPITGTQRFYRVRISGP